MAKREVTIIPAIKPKYASKTTEAGRKRRVAAYARVSTDSDEQFTSFEAQVDYYTKLINAREDWEFVEVYTDATDIIGLKQNPTNGRRFSPIFVLSGHFPA